MPLNFVFCCFLKEFEKKEKKALCVKKVKFSFVSVVGGGEAANHLSTKFNWNCFESFLVVI